VYSSEQAISWATEDILRRRKVAYASAEDETPDNDEERRHVFGDEKTDCRPDMSRRR
jgi:hypothetical protein